MVFFFVIFITGTIFIIILLIIFSTIIIIKRSPSSIIWIKSWNLSSYEWWINTSLPMSIRLIIRITSFYLFIIISFIDLPQRAGWFASYTLFNQILNFIIFILSTYWESMTTHRIIRLPVHLNIFPAYFICIIIIMKVIALFF